MHITMLSYRLHPKENLQDDSKSTYHHRQILAIVTNSEKKQKQRRSFLSDHTVNSNNSLPPVRTSAKKHSSIRIKGNACLPSKLHDRSMTSFTQPCRSHSRLSEKDEVSRARSRSVTPSGTFRSPSKLFRMRFGYPVKFRPSEFYAPRLTESELRLREDSFVNDSIRSAHHGSHSSAIPHYEPFDDPNLKEFFQSSLVLDVVRKTLNIDLTGRTSQVKKKLKINYPDHDYRRIVAKQSSGYGKLNGYNCIPPNAPPRHYRPMVHDKFQSSSKSSLASSPTHSSFYIQHKKNSRLNNKSKRLTPIVTSSESRNPIEENSDAVPVSNVSQE